MILAYMDKCKQYGIATNKRISNLTLADIHPLESKEKDEMNKEVSTSHLTLDDVIQCEVQKKEMDACTTMATGLLTFQSWQ